MKSYVVEYKQQCEAYVRQQPNNFNICTHLNIIKLPCTPMLKY